MLFVILSIVYSMSRCLEGCLILLLVHTNYLGANYSLTSGVEVCVVRRRKQRDLFLYGGHFFLETANFDFLFECC